MYYEFDDFTSSTPACPIIQYSVIDINIIYHLQKPESLNYKYGRDDDGLYVYQQGFSADTYSTPESVCQTKWEDAELDNYMDPLPGVVGKRKYDEAPPGSDMPEAKNGQTKYEVNADCAKDPLHCLCSQRQQPTTWNNTVDFLQYSPDDIYDHVHAVG